MTAWLGKMRKLRIALWLLVMAICLALWPAGSAVLQERHLINPYLQPQIKPYIPAGPPLVYWKHGQGAFVWDWQTGRHHRIPGKGQDICGVVGQVAIAENRPGEGIVVTDLKEPFIQRRYAVPGEVEHDKLLTLADSERLALFARIGDGKVVVTLVDLKKTQVLQRQTSQGEYVVCTGLNYVLARPNEFMRTHTASFWTVDPAFDELAEGSSASQDDFRIIWLETLGLILPDLAGETELRYTNAGTKGNRNLYGFHIQSDDMGPLALSTNTGFLAARRTSSDDRVVTLDYENTLQVWDVMTGKVVAEDRIGSQRFWFVATMCVLSLLAMVAVLGAMVRNSTLDSFFFDATILLAAAGSAGVAAGLGWIWIICISINVPLVAAVYIVFGSVKGWLPLALRIVAYVFCFLMSSVMFHVLAASAVAMEIPNTYRLDSLEELSAFAKEGIVLPFATALCFSLARWRGWTIGPGGNPSARGSMQFSLRTIVAITTVVALYVALWRWCNAISAELGESVLKGAVSCGIFGLGALFIIWLQMTNSRWWLVWLSIVLVPYVGFVVWGCLTENASLPVIAMGSAPILFGLVPFCLRLNGYRWIRDQAAAPPRVEPT